MRRAFIIAGHTKSGSGARSIHLDEADENECLKVLVLHRLHKLGVETYQDDRTTVLSGVIAWLKGGARKNDLILDIHFNASGNTSVSGTEVYIPEDSTAEERSAANLLLAEVSLAIGIKPRGVFPESRTQHKRIGILSTPAQGINLLLEVCYLTNQQDVILYLNRQGEVATAIAGVVYKYVKDDL